MPRPYFTNKSQIIDEIIRVNHAGEYGAKRIYEGQINCLKNEKDKAIIREMLDSELEHLKYFAKKINTEKVRPTFFMPLWNVCGYLLGRISAKFGSRDAMLLTEAVEEVIIQHYQEQIEFLSKVTNNNLSDHSELLQSIIKFKSEELDHKNIALENESSQSRLYALKVAFVKLLCKTAILISKKY